MKKNSKNRRFLVLLSSVPILLAIPWVGMQFTDEIVWDATDFLVAALLLFILVSLIEAVLRLASTPQRKVAFTIAVVIIFIVTWMQLAVGVFW